MSKANTADSILTLYNYKLPFPVAEYFCFAFRDLIVCNKKLNYKLFKDFIDYRNTVTYVFEKPIPASKESYSLIKLKGIEISIPINGEEEFMDKYSNWIFTSAEDVGLEWFDDEELPNENITLDKTKYTGRCKLTF